MQHFRKPSKNLPHYGVVLHFFKNARRYIIIDRLAFQEMRINSAYGLNDKVIGLIRGGLFPVWMHSVCYIMYWLLIAFLPHILASSKIDFNKCMEIGTFGYSYDSVYKMMPHNENGSTIEFYVKAKSDAHILFTYNANIIDPSHSLFSTSKTFALEVIIGGGRNTFSQIRTATSYGLKFIAKNHAYTLDIVSEIEYRGFWIHLTPSNNVEVGQLYNDTAFMAASISPQELDLQRMVYFSLSTWKNVKGHWRIRCPELKQSEIDGIEEMELTHLQKLRRDLTMTYETSIPPVPDNSPLNISFVASVHHFLMSWNDWKLRWDPADYNNITFFMAPTTDIWTPGLSVLMSSSSSVEAELTQVKTVPVFVKSDGTCVWMPPFSLQINCALTLENWPQETHRCDFPIVNKNYLDYTLYRDQIVLHAPSKNIEVLGGGKEWKMTAEVEHIQFDFLFTLIVSFTLNRNISGFTSVFIAPFISGAVLILASFWLKPDHKCKLHMSCCSTVIMTVFFIFFAEEVPIFAQNCEILNLYTFGLLLACGSTIHCILIKNINNGTSNFPYHIKRLITNPTLQNCLCLNATLENPTVYESLKDENRSAKFKESYLLSAVLDKAIFLIYLIVYISLILSYLY